MGWVYLVLAIVAEVAGTTSMKLSEGFTRVGPSVAIFAFYGLAFTLLTLALKTFLEWRHGQSLAAAHRH